MEFLTPKKTWKRVKGLAMKPLEGGPLELDPTKVSELFKIAWLATDADCHPSLRFQPAPKIDWAEVEAEAKSTAQGLIVGHEQSGSRWDGLKDLSDLGSLLGALPDETVMELFVSGESEVAKMRFAGTVEKGVWKLKESYPEVSCSTLRKTLEFANSETIVLESEEQAMKAEELALESFEGTHLVVSRDGTELTAELISRSADEALDLLRVFAFAVAFEGTPYHNAEILEREEEPVVFQFAHQLANLFAQPDPQGENLIFQGKFGKYFTASLIGEAHVVPEDTEILDQEMEELGFEVLGDLSCNKVMHTVMRGYSGPEHSFAIGMASAGGQFFVEFYTTFTDGDSLTTSNNPFVSNLPSKKIWMKSFPQLEPRELLKEHRSEMAKKNRESKAWEPNLAGLAQAIDEFMERRGLLF